MGNKFKVVDVRCPGYYQNIYDECEVVLLLENGLYCKIWFVDGHIAESIIVNKLTHGFSDKSFLERQ